MLASWCDNAAGLAGILGFSARLAGGGRETLLPLRSDGLSRPFTTEPDVPGDKRSALLSVEKDEETGVVGRRAGGIPCGMVGSDSREAFGGVRDERISSSWSAPNPRGGDRGESTVRVGANCGDEWRFIDMGLFCRLPGEIPGDSECGARPLPCTML